MSAKGGLNMKFDEYRLRYLDHLEEKKGFEGMVDFLTDTINNLLHRRFEKQERLRELEEQQQKEQRLQKESETSDADPPLQNLSLEPAPV